MPSVRPIVLSVIARSVATKQSSSDLDCFASLAMTGGRDYHVHQCAILMRLCFL